MPIHAFASVTGLQRPRSRPARPLCALLLGLFAAPLLARAQGQAPATPPSAAPPAAVNAEPPAHPAIPDTPAGRQLEWVIRCLNAGAVDDPASHFTDDFLAQVPPAQLAALFPQVHQALFEGKPARLIMIRPGATETDLAAEVAADPESRLLAVFIRVDPASGKMGGLLLRPVPNAPKLDNYTQLDELLKPLPGLANVGIFRLDTAAQDQPASLHEVHTLNPQSRLAIGSAFKLYVLGALAEKIQAGETAWDAPLEVQEPLKSLPSGDMQLQPAGKAFPVSHFADKMISISDNTATDHLLHLVGRDRVEAYMSRLNGDAARNTPFLSTLELFKIKLSGDRSLPQRFAAADEATRRAMIAPGGEVAAATPNLLLASAWKAPIEIDRVEWFATPAELAAVMADLRRLESLPGQQPVGRALRLNPGVPIDESVWARVAYKGGSEPGVINGVWMLDRKDGAVFVVALGWNNPEAGIDEARWIQLVGAAINLAAREPADAAQTKPDPASRAK